MLFAYAAGRPGRKYWMKDCRIGLDIAFLDDAGRILRLARSRPRRDSPTRTSRGDVRRSSRYVLETDAGWLGRHGVKEGDTVDVTRALVGVEPR